MIIASRITKTIFSWLPNSWHVGILLGELKGYRWVPKSANPGQVLGRYENVQERELIALFRSANCFWDVGAQVGWYSLMANRFMPPSGRIYAFEPHPDNYAFLEKHVTLNKIENITPLKVALSTKQGTSYFAGEKQQGQLSAYGQISVITTTADTLIEKIGDPPDLLKIDIEGAEIDFLVGAQKLLGEFRPTILLSTHGYQKRDACVEHLQNHGYQIRHIPAVMKDGDYVFIATP